MYFIDSHIHLQDYITQDIKNIVINAIKNNIQKFVNPSSHPSDWQKIEDLSKSINQIIPAFGVHPWYIHHTPHNWKDQLINYIEKNPKCFIGETGIDTIKNSDIEQQIEFLKVHINLAKKYNRPLIIHSVKANKYFMKLFDILPSKTIFHSYTGSIEWGNEIQKRGYYIGLNFSILRKKNNINIIKNLNINKILLETDGPYQSGIKNIETLPENIPCLANEIANIYNISTTEICQILYDNWITFLEKN